MSDALYRLERRRGVEVLTLLDDALITVDDIRPLREELVEILQAMDEPRLVMNLHEVSVLDSAGLGMLLILRATIERRSGAMVLAGVAGRLRDILQATKLDRVFPIHDSVEEAVESLLVAG